MSEALSAVKFRESIGEHFQPQFESARPLQLREVNDLFGDSSRADKQPFSLMFTDTGGSASDALPQGIYQLSNDRTGPLAIFLVCLGPDLKDDDKPLMYEAVFT